MLTGVAAVDSREGTGSDEGSAPVLHRAPLGPLILRSLPVGQIISLHGWRSFEYHRATIMRIAPEVETAFSLATREAARRRNEYVTLEHLLYALLFDADVHDVVQGVGGHVQKIKERLAA